jgi:undecaprenyl-diphosphatase
MIQIIQHIDNSILTFINNNFHNAVLDKLFVFLTTIGNEGLVWILISLLLIITKKYRKVGFISLVALLFTTICGDLILKNIVQRIRPSEGIAQIDLLVKKPSSYSFPSGHSGAAFAAAGVLAYYFIRYAVGIYVFAALIAFSRLYVNVHYPTDVLVGASLGFMWSRAVIYLIDKKRISIMRSKTMEFKER